MGWIEAVAELLDAIAWPVTVVVVVLLLRSALEDRIRHLRILKWRDGEAHFNEEAEHLELRAVREFGETPEAPDPEGRRDVVRSAWDLVHSYPRGAVLEAWLGLETELFKAVERAGLDGPRLTSSRAIQHLVRSGLLGENLASLFGELQRFRNNAVHAADFDLSTDAATTFVGTAGMLAARLGDVSP